MDPGTPCKNKTGGSNKDGVPHTPNRLHHTRFPLSSPYSGKSPLPIPIMLPSQYGIGKSDHRSSGRFTENGLVSKKLGYNDSAYSIGYNEEFEENNKIELFDKSMGKSQFEIPAVGTKVEGLPFFNMEKSTQFVTSLQNIHRASKSLKKVNDTVVDLNESLGAYLFGLFENAWCVNLSEHMTPETLNKIEQIKKLQKEVSGLQEEIDIVKRNNQLKEQRRKSTMPPPSIPRFSNIGVSRMVRKPQIPFSNNTRLKRRRDDENKQNAEPIPKKRTFLKAGSRNATFQSRMNRQRTNSSPRLIHDSNPNTNNIHSNNPRRQFGNGLNLSYATKIQTVPITDDSLSDLSGSDTSEVQTLTSIRRMQRSNDYHEYSNPNRNNNKRNDNTWEVRHRKPFR